MKNYNIALLNLMMGAYFVLYGHATVAETDMEKTAVAIVAKQEQAGSRKSSGQEINAAPAVDAGNTAGFQKPLDLSIPYELTESSGQRSGQNAAAQSLFAARKQRVLELNGGAVMTQEPEGEKQQSVDGAGIVFNLKAP